ncbi:hypothetical protein V493_03553 [Pseudogymnoascus sp. VKM F-4281 (FW-2241)]|nr:hypothetical protein V493_03553 [Pseudogymnoascus sp. VKM F-4281 (FW-2241)]
MQRRRPQLRFVHYAASVTADATVGFLLDRAIFHPGPVNVYLSEAASTAASYDGSGDWSKISELGASISTPAITFPASDIAEYAFKTPSSTRKAFSKVALS